jgi:hypothetical protein
MGLFVVLGFLVSVHRRIGFLGGKGALSELAITNSRGCDNPRTAGLFAKKKQSLMDSECNGLIASVTARAPVNLRGVLR